MTDDFDLDLDALAAARAEVAGHGFRFRLRGSVFELVPELPIDVLAPLLPHLPAVMELLKPAFASGSTDADDLDMTAVMAQLAANPNLPADVLAAFVEVCRRLFGVAWEGFLAAHPTFQDAQALAPKILAFYGVSLGESLRSVTSSATDGETSKQTSKPSTGSTPAKRSGNPARRGKASSAAVDS